MTNLKIGDSAPDFTLPLETGKDITLSTIADKHIVLYFYPKDDTPGCTIEAKNFNDLASEFEKLDTLVFGISKDGIDSHTKFKDKYTLTNLNLLSDEGLDICEKYGVWGKKNIMGKEYTGISRTTFLIDPDHKIVKIWEDVDTNKHADEVLKIIKAE